MSLIYRILALKFTLVGFKFKLRKNCHDVFIILLDIILFSQAVGTVVPIFEYSLFIRLYTS